MILSFPHATVRQVLYGMFCLWLTQSITACKEPEKKVEEAVTVTTFRLSAIDTTLYFDYVADIAAMQNVEVRSRVKGYLEKIFVDEGKQVTKGQVLFKINDEEYRVAVTQARAALKNAISNAKLVEFEVERLKSLSEKNIVPKSEYELALAKLDAANASIDEARAREAELQLRLNHTYIRAPFDGMIDRINYRVGSLIDEGTLLTTISDVKHVYAYFKISEKEYLNFIKNRQKMDTEGMNEVELVLADGSRYPELGKIETMESEFEQNTGSISFRAKFSNPSKILKHGSTGKIRLSEKIEQAVFVPQQAVFEIQDRYYVYKVDTTTRRAVMQSFIPLRRLTGKYLLKSGLNAGDLIVLEGILKISNGTLLKY